MRSPRSVPLALALLGLVAIHSPALAHRRSTTVREVDLVSDISGRADRTDANLVNPWGIVQLSDGTFRIADADAGVSTAYRADGTATGDVITIPGGGPTGVAVEASSFRERCRGRSGTTTLIFASEEGTLSTWQPGSGTTAVTAADIDGASYKGVAVATGSGGHWVYAANFLGGTIDVFDDSFTKLDWPGAFQDPNLPDDFFPWNIVNHNGRLYVAYAEHEPGEADEVKGAGLGYINVFDLHGNLLRRVVSGGWLNAPWGIAFAPQGSGGLENAMFVGNFGDGRINVFNTRTGDFIGALTNANGDTISIDGLWGIAFGSGKWNGGNGRWGRGDDGHDDHDRAGLYFTAGIEDEAHGLFGVLRFQDGNDRDRDHDRHAMTGEIAAASAVAPNAATAAVEPGVSLLTGNPVSVSRSSGVAFAVVVGRPSPLSFAIYDVSGRRMAQPFRGEEVSGSVQVRWNGRDEMGSPVAKGAYFYRATIGSVIKTGRFVIVP